MVLIYVLHSGAHVIVALVAVRSVQAGEERWATCLLPPFSPPFVNFLSSPSVPFSPCSFVP